MRAFAAQRVLRANIRPCQADWYQAQGQALQAWRHGWPSGPPRRPRYGLWPAGVSRALQKLNTLSQKPLIAGAQSQGRESAARCYYTNDALGSAPLCHLHPEEAPAPPSTGSRLCQRDQATLRSFSNASSSEPFVALSLTRRVLALPGWTRAGRLHNVNRESRKACRSSKLVSTIPCTQALGTHSTQPYIPVPKHAVASGSLSTLGSGTSWWYFWRFGFRAAG